MKKINKNKIIRISFVGVLMIVVVIVGIKLYETTLPEKHDDQMVLTVESDVLVDPLELENQDVIEEVTEEKPLNIIISKNEEVQLIEVDDNTVKVESSGNTSTPKETVEGKTLVIVNEEEPEVPEVPTVANEEVLTDSSIEPEYEDEPTVEVNQAVEGDVVKVETETKDVKDIPVGVNTTPAEDSDNPFMKPPTEIESGLKGDTDALEYSDYIPGTGDKF